MNLDSLLKAKNVEDEEPLDDDLDEPEADDDAQGPARGGPEAANPQEESRSREELVNEVRRLSNALSRKAAEVEHLSRRLEQMSGAAVGRMGSQAEEDALVREFEESYRRDPVRSIMLLVSRAKNDVLQQMGAAVMQLMKDQKNFSRAMEQFLGDPANAQLRPFREELEFLIDEANLSPGLAAALVQSVAKRHDEASAKRSAASRAVRNRAAVESDGEVGEPTDRDRQLDKVLKKSRTLEEMFAGLGKLKL